MLFIILALILIFLLACFICKKEFFENNNNSSKQMKYTLQQISHSVNLLVNSLQEPFSPVKIFYVYRNNSILSFKIMLQHNLKNFVKILYVKTKIPFVEKNANNYKLISIIDSRSIKDNSINGTTNLQSSASFKKI